MDPPCNTNEEVEKIVHLFSRLKDEYDGLASKNHRNLALLDLTIAALPKDIRDSSELCATFNQILDLENIDINSLMIKNNEMLLADHRDHLNQFESRLNGIKVKKCLKDLQGQTSLIKRMCARSLDDNETLLENDEKIVSSVAFMKEKLKGYSEQVKKLDETIAGIEPKLIVKEVIKCDEHIKLMDEEISKLQSELDRCRNLPPNMILAREKLDEEKLTLEKCEEELGNFIDNYVQIFK